MAQGNPWSLGSQMMALSHYPTPQNLELEMHSWNGVYFHVATTRPKFSSTFFPPLLSFPSLTFSSLHKHMQLTDFYLSFSLPLLRGQTQLPPSPTLLHVPPQINRGVRKHLSQVFCDSGACCKYARRLTLTQL